VEHQPEIAFVTAGDEPAALEIRVNFGLFAGREATAAEVDDLAHALLPDVGEVSIVSEQRHEVSEESEASVHQVRIAVARENLPRDPADVERLARHLVAAAERWAQACIADRSVELEGP
jgi:hypothetical protein